MKCDKRFVFFTLQTDSDGNHSIASIGDLGKTIPGLQEEEFFGNRDHMFPHIDELDRLTLLAELGRVSEENAQIRCRVKYLDSYENRFFDIRLSIAKKNGDKLIRDGLICEICEDIYSDFQSRHFDFEILVNSISTDFTGCRSDEIDEMINKSLDRIVDFSGMDRAYMIVFKKRKSVEKLYFRSNSGHVPRQFTFGQTNLSEDFPWMAMKLKNLETIYYPDVQEMPDEAEKEREYVHSQRVKSLIVVPLILQGNLYGFLGLDSLQDKTYWSINDRVLLSLCCKVFVNAITRQKAEDKILIANRLFEEVIMQSPVPMAVAAPDGKIMIFNRSCAESLGFDYEAARRTELNFLTMDHPWGELDSEGNMMSPEDLPLTKALHGEFSPNSEILILRSDGSKRWHMITGAPVFDSKGKLLAALVNFWDISKMKEIEEDLKTRVEQLQKSEARFRNYIESAPDGIFLVDSMGTILDVNRAACKITGYSEVDLLSKSIKEIVFKDDQADAMAGFSLGLLKGNHSGETRLLRSDNEVRNINVDMVRFDDNRYLGFVKDVTDTKMLSEQLIQMEKMDAIGQLAGGIAHDFNNQIAIIMGYSEMLLAELENPRHIKFARNILAGSHRSDDLTRKLLAFAHKGLYVTESMNLHRIIGEVVDILSHSLDKRISIHLDFQSEMPYTAGDPSQIQNIFINLALNSRDSMPDGGDLTLTTKDVYLDRDFCRTIPFNIQSGPYVKIQVSDTGSGIKEEHLGRIFEPFYTTKEPGKGTGMGLAGVFGAISNHHGAIEVSSLPGQGTDFIIYLPRINRENRAEEKDQIIKDVVSSGQASILLVDDEEMIRDLGNELLSSLGYKVHSCADGREGLKYFRDNYSSIDLVILDMIMPGIGGRDTFRLLREVDPHIAVIISSGFSLTGEIQQLLDEGASAFIGKPFERKNFSSIVASVLEKQ